MLGITACATKPGLNFVYKSIFRCRCGCGHVQMWMSSPFTVFHTIGDLTIPLYAQRATSDCYIFASMVRHTRRKACGTYPRFCVLSSWCPKNLSLLSFLFREQSSAFKRGSLFAVSSAFLDPNSLMISPAVLRGIFSGYRFLVHGSALQSLTI